MPPCRKCNITMEKINGECKAKCPKCGQVTSITQVMTRTVGYYANVSHMNDGKQEEVKDRKTYNIKKSMRKRSDLK